MEDGESLGVNTKEIQQRLREFAHERDWEQFHSPKNLCMALSGEVGELTELFQWLTDAQSRAIAADPKTKTKLEEEIADVAIYLLRLCDQTGVDLEAAIKAKIKSNAAKYPANLAKGNAKKYTELS